MSEDTSRARISHDTLTDIEDWLVDHVDEEPREIYRWSVRDKVETFAEMVVSSEG